MRTSRTSSSRRHRLLVGLLILAIIVLIIVVVIVAIAVAFQANQKNNGNNNSLQGQIEPSFPTRAPRDTPSPTSTPDHDGSPLETITNSTTIAPSTPLRLPFQSTEELIEAVDTYVAALSANDDALLASVVNTYGNPMNAWNVSLVTDFTSIFDGARNPQIAATFNEPLSEWDVSSATTMEAMFAGKISHGCYQCHHL